MTHEATILTGKVLQIRDKLMAKRHKIPNELKDEWLHVTQKTECFDPSHLFDSSVKGASVTKPMVHTGDTKELRQLVDELVELNNQVILSQVRH